MNWSGNGTNFIPESCCATAGGCKTGKSIPYPFIGNATKVWSEVIHNNIICDIAVHVLLVTEQHQFHIECNWYCQLSCLGIKIVVFHIDLLY